MSRPGKKVTRKTILMNSRIKEMELKERSSRSLLANVLDMDDDFRSASGISYAPTYNSNLTNRYSSGGVGATLPGSGGTGGGGGSGMVGGAGGGIGPGNSSTLPHFPSSASYHQQQASVGQQQSSVHHVESTLIHGNMISANTQSSTFGSRAGGFAIDEDIPTTPYCIQVKIHIQLILASCRIIVSFDTHVSIALGCVTVSTSVRKLDRPAAFAAMARATASLALRLPANRPNEWPAAYIGSINYRSTARERERVPAQDK